MMRGARRPLRHASLLAAVTTALLCVRSGVAQQIWCYRPLVRPAPPADGATTWGTSPIDRFAFAAMTAHGLQPSPAADRAVWLRRVTLDLTGLPPTPAELDAFVADTQAGASERVVDRLQQTAAFAERWAMWWLDLARYADSQGYEKDQLRPHPSDQVRGYCRR